MNGKEFARIVQQANDEARWPGITAAQEEVRNAHPNWSEKRVQNEAKEVWASRQARMIANTATKRPPGSTGNAP